MTTISIDAFPLQWPDGWPRTKRRTEPRYRVSYQQAVSEMLRELKLLGARNVVVSTNVPIRGDGLPYADWTRRKIDDPGVAVYFVRRGKSQVIACDSWVRVQQNIRAIGLTVVGLRAIQRAGATELLDRAFTGFKALPPAGGGTESHGQWRDILGVRASATFSDAQSAYRKLAHKYHPDRGGDAGAMAILNRAWGQAQAELIKC